MVELHIGYSVPPDSTPEYFPSFCSAIVLKENRMIDFGVWSSQTPSEIGLSRNALSYGFNLLYDREFDCSDFSIYTPFSNNMSLPDEGGWTYSIDEPILETPGRLSRFMRVLENEGRFAGFNKAIDDPVIYTDASVQEDEKSTGGYFIIDEYGNPYIGSYTMSAETIEEAELSASGIAMETALTIGIDDAVIATDNGHVKKAICNGHEDVYDGFRIDNMLRARDRFSDIQVTNISGSKNIVADALAADARFRIISNVIS